MVFINVIEFYLCCFLNLCLLFGSDGLLLLVFWCFMIFLVVGLILWVGFGFINFYICLGIRAILIFLVILVLVFALALRR